MVPAGDATEATLRELARHASKGDIIVDGANSYFRDSMRRAEELSALGLRSVDVGVSGGIWGLELGYCMMVGGPEDAVDHLRPLLDTLAPPNGWARFGKSGAGHTLKLIHNMVCHTIFLATCEGGRMAARAGVRLEDMIAVFNRANARSYASQVRFPRHILSGRWDGRSRIYNLHKDLAMAVSLAGGLGADVTLGRRTLAFLQRAIARGMDDRDFTLLYRDFEQIRRAPLRRHKQA